jgi:hypothetical protein
MYIIHLKDIVERRAASREAFVIKQQHKFVKAIESLGLKSANEEILKERMLMLMEMDNGKMLHFGSTIQGSLLKHI